MAQSNTTLFPVPINTGKIPKEGPNAVPILYDFSGGVLSYTTDMTQIHQAGKISLVQSIFVDNSANNGAVTVSAAGLNQAVSVQAGGQGVFPILVGGQAVFNVSSTGTVNATISYINVAMPGFLQWTSVPFSITGTVTTADTILDATVTGGRVQTLMTPAQNTDTNRSGTITTGGVAQNAMAANPARKGWMIMNIDETNLEPLGVRTTGAAALASAGTFTLVPSAGAGYPGGVMQGVGSGAISVIAATTGHKFTAIEW
jgi:hypothetical protein